jgi:hypothetical protein
VWWIVAGVVCWSGAVVAMLQAVTSADARCLTSLTSLAYGTDVHGLALPLQPDGGDALPLTTIAAVAAISSATETLDDEASACKRKGVHS